MTLIISEQFYSIQGEGPTAGIPAVFLRLKGCNLTCGGIHTVQTHVLDNGATWRCDTIETWTKGDQVTITGLLDLWDTNGWTHSIKNGAHIVITGGEPLLHQPALETLFESLATRHHKNPYIEIETNGTITPSASLSTYISQFNVSPKLANSGMPTSRRIVPETLRWFAKDPRAYFKFIVDTSDNWLEINAAFIAPFEIPRSQVLLMAAASTRQEMITKGQLVAELCKQESVRLSPRLQLLFWDRTVGI